MKLPYGLKDGKLVHISEVDKGKKCGCVCPACYSPFIARKGKKIIHNYPIFFSNKSKMLEY